MGSLRRIATIVPCLLLCAVATTAVAQNARDAQHQQDTPQQAQPDSRDNGGGALSGVLKAILDAKARDDRRRKAEIERRRQEDAAAAQQTEAPAVEEPPPAAKPVQITPAKRVPAVSKPKRPKPLRHKPKPSTPQQVVPRPAQIAPPVAPVVAPPVFRAAPIVLAPAVEAPPLEPQSPWIAIATIAAGVLLLLGSAAYAAHQWLGIGAPVPQIRASPDLGDPAEPKFDHDGPAIAFMLAVPTFTTTTDYPETAP